MRPVLFAHGAAADLAALLPEVGGEPEFYLSVRSEAAALLRASGYEIRHSRDTPLIVNNAKY